MPLFQEAAWWTSKTDVMDTQPSSRKDDQVEDFSVSLLSKHCLETKQIICYVAYGVYLTITILWTQIFIYLFSF